ncbi:MAG: 50S ribosomal protein L25 [Verrucomicrobiota bacterium]
MKSVPLKAYPRTQSRRGGARKLRAAGRVPAVIYGRQAKPQNLEVSAKEIGDLIHHSVSENLLVDLSVESDARARRLALVQEIQHHPLEGNVLHVDFHEVTEDEKVVILVPLETVGEAAGVKNSGGVLEHVVFKLKVRALPRDLPEQMVVDVSHLELGKSIHLGEIKAPAGVEILGDKNISVISVAMPRTEEEEAAAVAEGEAVAAGDVEMIKEKKEEGEEGAAPARGEKGAVKPGEKVPAKPGEKVPFKPGEKGAGAKPGEKAPAKGAAAVAPEKGAAKPGEKAPAEKKK